MLCLAVFVFWFRIEILTHLKQTKKIIISTEVLQSSKWQWKKKNKHSGHGMKNKSRINKYINYNKNLSTTVSAVIWNKIFARLTVGKLIVLFGIIICNVDSPVRLPETLR